MKILFLHGWTSKPGGVKPTYLSSHGHEVINPALPDDDFAGAVRIAQADIDQRNPDVIVGSSRGGAVAMNVRAGRTPLVLLCPAWKRYGTAKTIEPGTVILHSRADDVVLFAESEELVAISGLPTPTLIEVGTDHRLADPDALRAALVACEFAALPKNWYSIYQWGRTARDGYAELVASLVTAWLDRIELDVTGLRSGGFRLASHRGQAKLRTGISQFTEKRFCRALFNVGLVPGLGRVLDYEVPLKATEDAPHGDIDLLCVEGASLILVEAKQPSSNESILKAVLEAYTYSSLVASVRGAFLNDYGLPSETTLIPVVLTFPTATSGRQIGRIECYPRVRTLVCELNRMLIRGGVSPLRFFLVRNDESGWSTCLCTEALPNGDVRVVFREGFMPRVEEFDLVREVGGSAR